MAKQRRATSRTGPVFGKLKAEYGSWEAEVPVRGFKRPWSIHLEGADGGNAERGGDGDRGPTASQRDRFSKWIKAPGARLRVQEWLIAYYKKVVEGNYRAQMSPKEAALRAPVLRRPEQIWDLVNDDISLEIPRDPKEAGYDFKLRTNCDWDEEHGLELEVRGGKAQVNW